MPSTRLVITLGSLILMVGCQKLAAVDEASLADAGGAGPAASGPGKDAGATNAGADAGDSTATASTATGSTATATKDAGVPAPDTAAGDTRTISPDGQVADAAPRPIDAVVSDVATSTDPEPPRLAGMTRLHNAVRAQIPVPPLTWDPNLAAIAQAYAEKCVYQHSHAPNLGENIAANFPTNRPVSEPFKLWADEKADYDYATNTCKGMQCGHYTQIVWKTTKAVGCGVAVCTANWPFAGKAMPTWEFWVCNFSPPGNYIGQRPY